MQTKLTLRLDSGLISCAKRHARRRKQSLSKIVADYFPSFEEQRESNERSLSPTVKSMRGILKGARIDEKRDLHRHWDQKYR